MLDQSLTFQSLQLCWYHTPYFQISSLKDHGTRQMLYVRQCLEAIVLDSKNFKVNTKEAKEAGDRRLRELEETVERERDKFSLQRGELHNFRERTLKELEGMMHEISSLRQDLCKQASEKEAMTVMREDYRALVAEAAEIAERAADAAEKRADREAREKMKEEAKR